MIIWYNKKKKGFKDIKFVVYMYKIDPIVPIFVLNAVMIVIYFAIMINFKLKRQFISKNTYSLIIYTQI